MSFEPGESLWRLRKNHGRPKLYATPGKLARACVDYFQWVQDNPIVEEKIFQHEGKIVRTTVTKMRAMTLEGLCLHLGIVRQTLFNYRNFKNDNEASETEKKLAAVVEWAEDVMYEQKFTGAAAGVLSAVVISRALGLKEAVDNTHSAPGGGPVQTNTTFEFIGVNADTD